MYVYMVNNFSMMKFKNNNLISTLLFLNKKLIIHLYCHDFAIINVIVLLDIQQTVLQCHIYQMSCGQYMALLMLEKTERTFFVGGEGWLRL